VLRPLAIAIRESRRAAVAAAVRVLSVPRPHTGSNARQASRLRRSPADPGHH